MSRKSSIEKIIKTLREVQVLQGQGDTVAEACRRLGTTEQTYYRWRKEYGGLEVNQAKKLRDLESENTRLKRIVADLSLDNSILKETLKVKY